MWLSSFSGSQGLLEETRLVFVLYPDLPLTVCKPNKSNGVVVFTAMFRRELREIRKKKKGELREGPEPQLEFHKEKGPQRV